MSNTSKIPILGIGLAPGHPALTTHPSAAEGRYETKRYREELKAMYAEIDESPYEPTSFFFDPAKGQDFNEFLSILKEKEYRAVMVGWGIRGHAELTELFEQIINAVRRDAPNSLLCFDTKAADVVRAVERVLGQGKK